MTTRLAFEHILTPAGIESGRTIVADEQGMITAIEPTAPGTPSAGFLALPGLPNAHSHAFQRALAGFGEAARGDDSFWSWRDAMYRLADTVTPEQVNTIARQAYGEMLSAGFTAVAEFHYLHHVTDGDSGMEMAQAVLEAAAEVGLPMLLLPVLYQAGGFDEPPRAEQGRFLHRTVEEYLKLLERIAGLSGAPRLGVAPHSLRAVPAEAFHDLLEGAEKLLGPRFPIHIHISEQRTEVRDSHDRFGLTPIERLAEIVELDDRWSLVHATHATPEELELVRAARATVVLCPLTEAYLGDGIFPARAYLADGGIVAIGSDSNVRIDAVEELRTLEYGQRLRDQRRARLADASGLGAPLWNAAARGGSVALEMRGGALEIDSRADIVVVAGDAAVTAGHEPSRALDAWVVGGSRSDVAAVYVGGQPVSSDGAVERARRQAYGDVIRQLSGTPHPEAP